MLSLPEKILFLVALVISIYAACRIIVRISRIIARGNGKIEWATAQRKALNAIIKSISLQPTWRIRIIPSILHAFVAWAFMYYLLVNLVDILEGMLTDFHFAELIGPLGGPFRLVADLLSVLALFGMILLLLRRFVIRPSDISTRDDVFLNPKARFGILRDSLVVGIFILIHVGSRFLSQTFTIALNGTDPWQPVASTIAVLWSNLNNDALQILVHVSFWLAIGTILAFIPYFLYSKHIHLFFGPLNFLLKPERKSIGELATVDFEDQNIDQFGATHLEDLGWEQIMDAYACIMCYRCQQVCPAYSTGKVLSPAALEINKRYLLNSEGAGIARGEQSSQTLIEFVIPAEAIWGCTSCGACTDICPVGNEPMRDIIDIRRALVLMDNDFPEQLQTAFRGMERTANPWNISPSDRMNWAEGLGVKTIADNPKPEILWWVGCAPATDARAQKTAQAFAKILNTSGINYSVLGENERCTGDSARRAGNEYLFYELALSNIEILNDISPVRIVTTCPHCLHTLKNEYPAYGGNYQVIHHTQLINEMLNEGKISIDQYDYRQTTFHDPCYLGRQNGILIDPRDVIRKAGNNLVEMTRSGSNSFCCGAGGSQMWKEEQPGDERVSTNRFREAAGTGADILAIGCPFCMIMLTDARNDTASDLQILDIAEIVAQKLK